MAAAPYPAVVAATGATALSGVTQQLVSGDNQITLPVIVPSGASAGQANAGDVVYVQTNELARSVIIDWLGRDIGGMDPLRTGFFLASPNLVWKLMGDYLPVAFKVIPKGSVNTLAFGAATAPAIIATPGSIAGVIPVIGPNGAIGYIPFWQ